MDKFETMKQTMSNMSDSEREKTIKEYRTLCVCPDCPTYNECAKVDSELAYCIVGESYVCIVKEAGCICPACPLTEKLGLTYDYFCIKGTESKQRKTQ